MYLVWTASLTGFKDSQGKLFNEVVTLWIVVTDLIEVIPVHFGEDVVDLGEVSLLEI